MSAIADSRHVTLPTARARRFTVRKVITFLVLALWAFRRRRVIAGWLRAMRNRYFDQPSAPNA